ncbi:glycoside hydrolase family 16 protein [Tengunoibacter tsumagoiensis]|uniref:GH16 domain-containing protein n=1 Tax=Tengunoibacter tsumagoiensis TaxID=2014871 RepID=A0A402AAS8_9CHLR|nr:glycoside hydrolase family 16 protein [Tengunoibacter tsumagoiensis]GCE16041.1 hypothetical protein KTT_59000 [Tengunoibacter tsumagoiensis]
MSDETVSGQAMPIGDLPGWHQVFAEDFNIDVPIGQFPGSVYGHKFTVYPDGTPDTAGQAGKSSRYYPSKVVSVKNSLLSLYLHEENGIRMAAAILPVLPGNHLFGKYTIRFKSDPVPGFKTAWLLWPNSENWPHDGEVDFPEGDLTSTIGGFVHHQNGRAANDQAAFSTIATYPSWHTVSTEWYPNQIHFILDGQTIGISTSRIPNTPMHWVIQTESSLPGPACDVPTGTGYLSIDWVVAYTLVH